MENQEPKIESNEYVPDLKLTYDELDLLGAGLVELSLKGQYSTGETVDQDAAKALLKKLDVIENSR